MKSLFLITTSLENTWQSNKEVIFLGEWAKRYDRKHIWQRMNAVVSPPLDDESQQKCQNLEFIQNLSSQLLNELTIVLNSIHKVNFSERQWKIVLGHWLYRFVSVSYNRFFTIQNTLNNFNITGTYVIKFKEYQLSTNDSNSFIWACNDDIWNHVFYSRVLKFLEFKHINYIHPQEELSGFKQPIGSTHADNKSKLSPTKLVRDVLGVMRGDDDAFILNTHLSLIDDLKLQISLGQIPQFWVSPKIPDFQSISEFRVSLLDCSQFSGFEKFVRQLLGEVIPSCFLEGFTSIRHTLKKISWPKNPKFIYTVNNFDVDEVFKLWVAFKIGEGFPYYVGQHGGGYGTHKYYVTANPPEKATSDRFLTWGWSDDNPKTIPSFIFNVVGHRSKAYFKSGGLLLVELSPHHNIWHWDIYYERSLYQDEQYRFVDALEENIKCSLTVRLHSADKYFSWATEKRWSDYNPSIRIDNGDTSIKALVKKSRLVVYSYDSTGILENLALNIPTVCFWNGGLSHLLTESKPYYQLLVDAKILFFTPESAAKHISNVWENVDSWWQSNGVQEARHHFCDKYAKVNHSPIKTLTNLLK